MKAPFRGLAILVAASLALVLVSAAPAAAESRGLPCGRVTAFTPPTATTPGSIRLGTTTYLAAAGALPNPPPPNLFVGSTLCLVGQLDSTGAFTSLATATLGEQAACGPVGAFTPATATAPGSLTLVTNASWTMPVRAGLTLSPAQTTGAQCFKFEINADGNTEVVGYYGPVRQLPNTSTRDSSQAGGTAMLILVGAWLVALSLFRIRIHDGVVMVDRAGRDRWLELRDRIDRRNDRQGVGRGVERGSGRRGRTRCREPLTTSTHAYLPRCDLAGAAKDEG